MERWPGTPQRITGATLRHLLGERRLRMLSLIESLGYRLVTERPEPLFEATDGSVVDLDAIADRIDRDQRILRNDVREMQRDIADEDR